MVKRKDIRETVCGLYVGFRRYSFTLFKRNTSVRECEISPFKNYIIRFWIKNIEKNKPICNTLMFSPLSLIQNLANSF